ncbi:MAG: phosphoribosylformylglycinamidine cyclo-ligase [Candidatus Latescibacteria bacterium]|nr:phosphoribosylformylglycinamidine cyclo-ligase [Candidatus Latescibacterota bacterium]
MNKRNSAYARAGVDIEAANQTKKSIAELVRTTFGPQVIGSAGGFGGLFRPDLSPYKDPVLVSSVDSVGTKLKIAFASGFHNTVGRDMVFHCANDILVQGARPLFFLDYLAMGSHAPEVATAVVEGLASGCRTLDCALIGGETAELPDMYQPGEYDLAGTIVGMVDRSRLLDGQAIAAGDRIIGLGSDGLHTNGYSLARRVIFEQAGLALDDPLGATGRTVVEELLRVHRPYVTPVLALSEQVPIKGMVHITGGGLWDNIPRVLPPRLSAQLVGGAWEIPPVFHFIEEAGQIESREMYHVFNMGLGLLLFVGPDQAEQAVEQLRAAGERAWLVGEVVVGDDPVLFDI